MIRIDLAKLAFIFHLLRRFSVYLVFLEVTERQEVAVCCVQARIVVSLAVITPVVSARLTVLVGIGLTHGLSPMVLQHGFWGRYS